MQVVTYDGRAALPWALRLGDRFQKVPTAADPDPNPFSNLDPRAKPGASSVNASFPKPLAGATHSRTCLALRLEEITLHREHEEPLMHGQCPTCKLRLHSLD